MQESKDYNQLVATKGWQRFSKKLKEGAEKVGLLSVWPGNITDEQRTRANECLRIINEVERSASKLEELEDKFRKIK